MTFNWLLAGLLVLTRLTGQGDDGDRIAYGEDVVVAEGESVGGNVIVFGGDVEVQEGANVGGDVTVFGGEAEIDGTVGGDVVATGGSVTVGGTAVIGGEAIAIGGVLDIDESAQVGGSRVQGPDIPRVPSVPDVPRVPTVPDVPRVPEAPPVQRWWWGPMGRFQNYTLNTVDHLARTGGNAVMAGVLAVLLLLALPKPMTRVSETIIRAPVAAGGVGFIGLVCVPLLAVLMTITCVFIPVALGVGIAYVAALAVGWVAVGLLFGKQLLIWFRIPDQPPTVAAGLGALGLTLLVGVVGAVPYLEPVSALTIVTVASVGIGAVALTRFGARAYPVEGPSGGPITPGEETKPDEEPAPTDETKPGEGTKPLE
jgi:hypothetical protein